MLEESGGQHDPLDFRLTARFGAWRVQGVGRDDAMERAAKWPDLYAYWVRKGRRRDIALRRLEAYTEGDRLPADLLPEERPANVQPARVRLALERMRENRESQVVHTYRHLTETRGAAVEAAILDTCRICGWGPGRADLEGRGEGLSEVIGILAKAGFADVEKVRLRSPRARRRR